MSARVITCISFRDYIILELRLAVNRALQEDFKLFLGDDFAVEAQFGVLIELVRTKTESSDGSHEFSAIEGGRDFNRAARFENSMLQVA